MSARWGRNAAVGNLIAIRHQIIDANEAVELERIKQIHAARESVRLQLLSRGLIMASVAVRTGGEIAFSDFRTIKSTMHAGGFHCVRLTGGRGIDPDNNQTRSSALHREHVDR